MNSGLGVNYEVSGCVLMTTESGAVPLYLSFSRYSILFSYNHFARGHTEEICARERAGMVHARSQGGRVRRPVSLRKAKRVGLTRRDYPQRLTTIVRLQFPQGTRVSAHCAAQLCHATNSSHPQGATRTDDCHILRPRR